MFCSHSKLPVEILKSAGGYYVGQFCPKCGPYSRVSPQYGTEFEARRFMKEMKKK